MATPKEQTRLAVQKTFKLYIGGRFPRTESGRSMALYDAGGQFVANACRASRKDFRDAVVAARAATGGWAGRSAFNRGQILYRMAEMLESRRDGFEKSLQTLVGYDSEAATAEVDAAIDRLVYYAGWSDKFAQIFGSTNPVASNHFNFSIPEPVGLVTAFSPRNAPLLGVISILAPVITSGNTLVLIIDNLAPSIAIDLAEVLATSDLPGGVVNLLTGLRKELLSHVTRHMDVDAIAAFGVDADEQQTIGVEAAESVKRIKLFDDPAAADWTEGAQQSPYWILPFVEFKTAWHPIGI